MTNVAIQKFDEYEATIQREGGAIELVKVVADSTTEVITTLIDTLGALGVAFAIWRIRPLRALFSETYHVILANEVIIEIEADSAEEARLKVRVHNAEVLEPSPIVDVVLAPTQKNKRQTLGDLWPFSERQHMLSMFVDPAFIGTDLKDDEWVGPGRYAVEVLQPFTGDSTHFTINADTRREADLEVRNKAVEGFIIGSITYIGTFAEGDVDSEDGLSIDEKTRFQRVKQWALAVGIPMAAILAAVGGFRAVARLADDIVTGTAKGIVEGMEAIIPSFSEFGLLDAIKNAWQSNDVWAAQELGHISNEISAGTLSILGARGRVLSLMAHPSLSEDTRFMLQKFLTDLRHFAERRIFTVTLKTEGQEEVHFDVEAANANVAMAIAQEAFGGWTILRVDEVSGMFPDMTVPIAPGDITRISLNRAPSTLSRYPSSVSPAVRHSVTTSLRH